MNEKMKALAERIRQDMKDAGCCVGCEDCAASHEAFVELVDEQEAMQNRIADSKRFIWILSGCGIVAVGLIAWAIYPLRYAMDPYRLRVAIFGLLMSMYDFCCVAAEVRALKKYGKEIDHDQT